MKRIIVIIILVFILGVAITVFSFSKSPTKDLENSVTNGSDKPVILITVDSLMSEPLQKAIKEGRAPAFSFLINNGQFYTDIISSYPTMSVTIDSTVLTGTYANQHKIPGLIWFNEDKNRIISYGSGISEIWHTGIKNVTTDSIINLNSKHLSKDVVTIHEELAERSIPTASINGLLFRGSIQHDLTVPKIISGIGLLPKNITMNGPTILSLGALSQYNPDNDWQKFIWQRLGENNQFTVNELKFLIGQNKLPPLTLAYFPDADADLHKHGPDDLKAIEKADQSLQEVFNSYPSWEQAINQVTWVVFGDSAQSSIKKDKDTSLIDLNDLLKSYTFWERKNKDGQIAIAVNERMAYIYLKDDDIKMSDVIDTLKKDDRIAFLAWKDRGTNIVSSTTSNQEFSFLPNGSFRDMYDQSWNIKGDVSILDLTISSNSQIQYGDYPDALARLYGALHSQEGRFIIVDAKPQYEFIEKHSHDHAGGGAHGSLHKVDSIVPLIIAGTNEKPKYNRLVDFKGWILNMSK